MVPHYMIQALTLFGYVWVSAVVAYFGVFLLLLLSWQALSMVTLRTYVHNGRGLAVGRYNQKIKIRTVCCPEFKNAPQRKVAHLNRNESCTKLHVSETLYLLRSSVACAELNGMAITQCVAARPSVVTLPPFWRIPGISKRRRKDDIPEHGSRKMTTSCK